MCFWFESAQPADETAKRINYILYTIYLGQKKKKKLWTNLEHKTDYIKDPSFHFSFLSVFSPPFTWNIQRKKSFELRATMWALCCVSPHQIDLTRITWLRAFVVGFHHVCERSDCQICVRIYYCMCENVCGTCTGTAQVCTLYSSASKSHFIWEIRCARKIHTTSHARNKKEKDKRT